MRIGIDIDNVLSKFDEELLKEFIHHDKDLRNTGIINKDLYITKGMFDWSKEEFDDFYYNNIERIAKNLQVIDNAPEYIKKLKNDKTYIMAIGAPTNVSLAIKKEPKILDRIEVVWLGGHSLLQDNNWETNFRHDLEATRVLFESKVKLTVIPCKNVSSNLRTSVYELNHYLKDKSELCNYLIDRFYNDGYHGIQERRVIWDISVIAYLINKLWFTSKEISCPNIKDDTSYELTTDNYKITMINYIDVDKVYKDLFSKLGE